MSRWTPLLFGLLACRGAPPGSGPDADGVDTTTEAVGHQGPTSGEGARPSGPPKSVGGVAFAGVAEMRTDVPAGATSVDPGEATPAPISQRSDRLDVASEDQYVRFFVTLGENGTVGLAGEAITLPGTLVPPPRPVGTLLVVSGNDGGDLAVASFVDPRARQSMNLGTAETTHQSDPQATGSLNLSAPVGTTLISVWELPADAVPWNTPLTVSDIPTLTADATLLGTVEYKP